MPQQLDPNRYPTFRMHFVSYPQGLPLRWQDEQSGRLRTAVLAYLDFALQHTPELSPEHLALVRDYCRYYVFAPCWEFDGQPEELEELRERITSVQSFDELNKWIHDCLDIGLDPL